MKRYLSVMPNDMFFPDDDGPWVKYEEVRKDFEALADVHNENQRLKESLKNCGVECEALRQQLEKAQEASKFEETMNT